jgi:hypothetical protein
MSFASKDGKKSNSKFRANRRDRESAVQDGMESQKGPRAQANAVEGKGNKSPESREEKSKPAQVSGGASDMGGDVNSQAAGTMGAKAKEVHITHDDNMGHHHVHVVHHNGMEEHTDHQSRDEAHFHGAMSAGVAAPEDGNSEDFPKKRTQPETSTMDADDYDVEPLD